MADYNASLTVDLGPEVPLEVLAAVFADATSVLAIAQAAQQVLDRNEAYYSVRRSRRRFGYLEEFDEILILPGFGYTGYGQDLPRAAQHELDELLRAYGRRQEIAVTSLTYGSPFGMNFSFNGGGIARILEVIRDWGADRRIADAEADIAESRARDYESRVRSRTALRERLIQSLTDEGQVVGREQVEAVLGDEALRAVESLVDADVTLEIESTRNA